MIYFSSKKRKDVNKPEWAEAEWEGGRARRTVPSPAEVAVSDVMLVERSPGTEAPGHTGLRRSNLECAKPRGDWNLGGCLMSIFYRMFS